MVLLALPESPAVRLRRGILGYWPLDGAGGAAEPNKFPRVSPFDMAVTGTVTSAAGPSANLPLSRVSGGGANFLSAADNAYIPSGATRFTAGGWAYMTSKASTRPIIAHQQATGNLRSWSIYYDSSADRFVCVCSQDGTTSTFATATDSSLGSPSTNTWYHVIGGFDGARAWIQVNALARVYSSASIAGLFDTTETMRILHDGTTGFVGRLSHVGLWERMLRPYEVSWLYNNGLGRDLTRGC